MRESLSIYTHIHTHTYTYIYIHAQTHTHKLICEPHPNHKRKSTTVIQKMRKESKHNIKFIHRNTREESKERNRKTTKRAKMQLTKCQLVHACQ